jgi:hypothetical protein
MIVFKDKEILFLSKLFSALGESNLNFDYCVLTEIDCDDDLWSITGKDIDIFVSNLSIAHDIFMKLGMLVRRGQYKDYRYYKFFKKSGILLVIDISIITDKHTLDYNIIKSSFFSRPLGANVPRTEYLFAHKIIKYYLDGFFSSNLQLSRLLDSWDNLDNNKKIEVEKLLRQTGNENIFSICQSLSDNVSDNRLDVHSKNARHKRERSRIIYQGKIKWRNFYHDIKSLYRFLRGFLLSSNFTLPAVAIVGNDGSGKTTTCREFINRYHKLEPLWVSMRTTEPIIPVWKYFRPLLIRKQSKHNAPLVLNTIMYFGEVMDYLDRMVKYKIGMAWANSGLGVTFFERYPTDRIRGEYKPGFYLLPLEKFFPMPHSVILLDISADISLARKSNDGHTDIEMIEKRDNYKELIKEINPSFMLNVDSITLESQIFSIFNYILEQGVNVQSYKGIRRKGKNAIWSPNKERYKLISQIKKAKNSFTPEDITSNK